MTTVISEDTWTPVFLTTCFREDLRTIHLIMMNRSSSWWNHETIWLKDSDLNHPISFLYTMSNISKCTIQENSQRKFNRGHRLNKKEQTLTLKHSMSRWEEFLMSKWSKFKKSNDLRIKERRNFRKKQLKLIKINQSLRRLSNYKWLELLFSTVVGGSFNPVIFKEILD